jgi:hypothetical protein
MLRRGSGCGTGAEEFLFSASVNAGIREKLLRDGGAE